MSERPINVDHGVTTTLPPTRRAIEASRVIDHLRLMGARFAVRYEQ